MGLMYSYGELKDFVDHCGRCPLSRTRNRAVMGKGNLHSPVLFIAEAPGRNEDRDGIPFTGRSGELFDRLLGEIGMNREEIYLTNIVKCHPPGNRDPEAGGAGDLSGRSWMRLWNRNPGVSGKQRFSLLLFTLQRFPRPPDENPKHKIQINDVPENQNMIK